VLLPGDDLETAVLDLAAVLEGLVGHRFEILLVSPSGDALVELQARAPGLPIRAVDDTSVVPAYDLIFVAARDGQFDVRELNHLYDAIERGADVAAGYRPRRTDGLVRAFQRWGWGVDVDYAYELVRRDVWLDVRAYGTELLGKARRLGYRVSEVPVSHRRPTLVAA
jgi:hypothetical protein